MNEQQIRDLLEPLLSRESPALYKPTDQDWEELQERQQWAFSNSFKNFINLMSEFNFEGDILNVIDHPQGNGNDTIELTYRMELESGWNKEMIPFFSIGNGDHFCLSAKEGENSAVYYVYHDSEQNTVEYENFEAWLLDIEEFI